MRMSTHSQDKCASAPVSSFTIRSILGAPADTGSSREHADNKSPTAGTPRKRALSVSVSCSEDEASGAEAEAEDSADCCCSETGLPEPCSRHRALTFPCLGKPTLPLYPCYKSAFELIYLSRAELCVFRRKKKSFHF